MSREWKPGDVAMSKGHVIFRAELVTGEPRWHDKFGVLGSDDTWPTTSQIRPLVVIDPEDREQVERLADAFGRASSPAIGWTTQMQAALREFADPKPPIIEPQGLGAVVEASAYTDELRPFVRCPSDTSPWTDEGGNGHAWSELDAVRVLSEGIQ